MLDAHHDIQCGDETKIIPGFIQLLKSALSVEKLNLLSRNGVTYDTINSASKLFIYDILEKHSSYSPVLCAKDPTILTDISFLINLFPTSKFIFMIRDARPVILSIQKRGVLLGGFGQNLIENFQNWNSLVEEMNEQCILAGTERCLRVYYEQVVLHPETEMRKILKFLNVEWSDAVLHHEDYFGSKIKLSDHAKSADQVIKPVNIETLYGWVNKIPQNVLDELDTIAPMLKKLGYDTKSKKPDYGKPDQRVLDNTFDIKANEEKWIQLKLNYSQYYRNATFRKNFQT